MKISFEPDDGDRGDCGSLILTSENQAECLQLSGLMLDIPRNLIRSRVNDPDHHTVEITLKS